MTNLNADNINGRRFVLRARSSLRSGRFNGTSNAVPREFYALYIVYFTGEEEKKKIFCEKNHKYDTNKFTIV